MAANKNNFKNNLTQEKFKMAAPGKKVQCSYCSKVMRSDNLKKHVKIHEKAVINSHPRY